MKIIYFLSIIIASICLLIPVWIYGISEWKFWKEKTDIIIIICLSIPILLIDTLMFLYFFG